jgi:uncharacterized protein YdcH (DUF465 family)
MRKAALPGVEKLETLVNQHRQWDERIRELGRHAYLTPAEEAEVRELKKLKLAAKDRIADIEGGRK